MPQLKRRGSVVSQRQGLYDTRVGFAAFTELIQGQFVVVVLVHLTKDLVHSPLWCILILGRRCLTLQHKRNFFVKATQRPGQSPFQVTVALGASSCTCIWNMCIITFSPTTYVYVSGANNHHIVVRYPLWAEAFEEKIRKPFWKQTLNAALFYTDASSAHPPDATMIYFQWESSSIKTQRPFKTSITFSTMLLTTQG